MKENLKAINYCLEKNWRLILGTLLVIQTFFLILAFFFCEKHITGWDTPDYIAPAKSFLEQGIMLDRNGTPIWFRTPGYPFFLALIYGLTNYNHSWVMVIQMIMCLLNTMMIFSVVKSFTKKNSLAILASVFYVCDFATYPIAVQVLTDVPFSFLMTLSLFLFVKFLSSPKTIYGILAVLSFNYALLVRPAVMYLNISIAIVLLIAIARKKINWKLPLFYVLILLLAMGGWSIRNAHYHGKALYTSIRIESLYQCYAPIVFRMEENVSEAEAQSYFKEQMNLKYPNFKNSSRLDQVEAQRDIGGGYIREHIWSYLKLNLKGLLREMLGPNWSDISQMNLSMTARYLLAAFVITMLAISYLIYAIGFIRNIRYLDWIDWAIFLTVVYLMASTAVLGYSRYRLAFYTLSLIGTFICWRKRAA